MGDPCDKCGRATGLDRDDIPEGIVWCDVCAALEAWGEMEKEIEDDARTVVRAYFASQERGN